VLLSFWRWITSWTVVVARTWSELATSVAGAPTEVISPALSLQLSYLRRRRLVYTKSPPSIDIRDRRPRRRPPPLLSATSWTQMYYSSARCVPRGAPAQDVTSIIVPRPSARAPSPPDHTPRSQTIDKCAHVNCRQLQPSTTGWPQKSTEWQRNVVKTVEQHFLDEFLWIRRTCDCAYYCMLFISRFMVRVRVRIRFWFWLVSGYAHAFILLSVVVVTLP